MALFFFFLVVFVITTAAMLAMSYDRHYKTIVMLEPSEFIGFFILYTIVSMVFTAFLFEHPLVALTVVGILIVLIGAGFGVYRGLLHLKDVLNSRRSK